MINDKNIFVCVVIGIIMGSLFLKHDHMDLTHLLRTPTSFSHGCLVCYENNKLYCKKISILWLRWFELKIGPCKGNIYTLKPHPNLLENI